MADVKTRELDWDNLVKAAEGEAFYQQPVAYEFQGGRVFKDKGADSAIYATIQYVVNGTFDENVEDWSVEENAGLHWDAGRLRVDSLVTGGVPPVAYQRIGVKGSPLLIFAAEVTVINAWSRFYLGTTIGGNDIYDSGENTNASHSFVAPEVFYVSIITNLNRSVSTSSQNYFDNISLLNS